MANKDNYQLLVEKLDQFIRKYYVNKLIRGSLYSIGLILVLFLGVSFLENYFYHSVDVQRGMMFRRMMFFSFLGVSVLGACILGTPTAPKLFPPWKGDQSPAGSGDYWRSFFQCKG